MIENLSTQQPDSHARYMNQYNKTKALILLLQRKYVYPLQSFLCLAIISNRGEVVEMYTITAVFAPRNEIKLQFVSFYL
jgi:hypothetical protein